MAKLEQRGVIDKDEFLRILKNNHLSEATIFGRIISKNNNIKVEHFNTIKLYLIVAEHYDFISGSRKNFTLRLKEIIDQMVIVEDKQTREEE